MIAIKNVYSEKYLEEILEQFYSGNPPFINSSAFYYYTNNDNGNSNKTYYLPRPIFKKFEFPEETSTDVKTLRKQLEKLKKFKKKSEVDLLTFESIINGEKSELDLYNEFNPGEESNQETFNRKEIITKKASLDRLTSTTREENGRGLLFSMNEIYLENGGLFFLVEGDTSNLEPALRFLHHYGFGADSSNGKGHFSLTDPILEDFAIRQPENSEYFVNLGIYHPLESDIIEFKKNEEKVFYSLEKRAGKAGVTFFKTVNIFKDSVVCFGEGSVFPNINSKSLIGKLSIVREEESKKIYHNGLGFMIKANLREI